MTPEDRKLYDMQLKLMSRARASLPQDIWEEMSQAEREDYAKGVAFGDMEYEQEVFQRGGATIAQELDAARAKVIPAKKAMAMAEYVPNYERASKLNAILKEHGAERPDSPVDEDQIVFYPQKETHLGVSALSPTVAAHEYMHRSDFRKDGLAAGDQQHHVDIYARLGWNSKSQRDWNDAVKTLMFYLGSSSYEEAEEAMKALIEERKERFELEEQQAQSLLGLPRK